MRLACLAAAAGFVAAGCRDAPSEPVPSRFSVNEFEVVRVDEGIRLTNGTNQPVAYAVWASGFLGLFAPCVDASANCPRLAPGASVTVLRDEIDGIWDGEREAIVRWWRVVADGSGGYRAGALREITIAI